MRRKRKIQTTGRRKRRKGDEIWLGGAKEKKDEGGMEGTLSLPCSHHRNLVAIIYTSLSIIAELKQADKYNSYSCILLNAKQPFYPAMYKYIFLLCTLIPGGYIHESYSLQYLNRVLSID